MRRIAVAVLLVFAVSFVGRGQARAQTLINLLNVPGVNPAVHIVSNVTSTQGSTSVSVTGEAFSQAAVGELIYIGNSLNPQNDLWSTIAAKADSSHITLADPMPVTQSGIGEDIVFGYDSEPGLATAYGMVNTNWSTGNRSCIYVPSSAIIINQALPVNSQDPTTFNIAVPGCVIGSDGPNKSFLYLGKGFSGDLMSWSDTWAAASLGAVGARVANIDIVGYRGSGALNQNGLAFYDRNDQVSLEDVNFRSINGRAFYAGGTARQPVSTLRESQFKNLRIFWCGNGPQTAAFEITYVATSGIGEDGSNSIQISNIRIFGSFGPSLVLRSNDSQPTKSAIRGIQISNLSVEGDPSISPQPKGDLIQIGDPNLPGTVNDISINGADIVNPYASSPTSTGAAIHLYADTDADAPYLINFNGNIFGVASGGGNGIQIDRGHDNRFIIDSISSVGTNVTIGGGAAASNAVYRNAFIGFGAEPTWSWSVASNATPIITNYSTSVPVASTGSFGAGSKVDKAATGTPIAIPAGTSWLALTQTGTVATQTITLPTSPTDGQIIRITSAGPITALTLSPSVAGAPTSLAAAGGFTAGYDMPSSHWTRVQ